MEEIFLSIQKISEDDWVFEVDGGIMWDVYFGDPAKYEAALLSGCSPHPELEGIEVTYVYH